MILVPVEADLMDPVVHIWRKCNVRCSDVTWLNYSTPVCFKLFSCYLVLKAAQGLYTSICHEYYFNIHHEQILYLNDSNNNNRR